MKSFLERTDFFGVVGQKNKRVNVTNVIFVICSFEKVTGKGD